MTEPFRSPPALPPHTETVRAEWVDYNGHLNVAYYVLIFDQAAEVWLSAIGLGEAYRRSERGSLFVVETHVTYLREVHAGDQVRVETLILGHDEKRLHAFLSMVHAGSGELAATSETLFLHVDIKSRRSATFPAFARERLGALAALHAASPRPREVGRAIALGPRR